MGTKVLGLIMAGGKGERLYPLTRDRAKPAVPFGGKYRIVDFVLSNFVNSGIRSLYVLTQFKSQSLIEHIRDTWKLGSVLRDQFVSAVPAQMQQGESWYRGTADAVRQNLNLVHQSDPDIVAVFGADHIYRMDVSQMVNYHVEKKADITIAALPVPRGEARGFGIIKVDGSWRVQGFQEKPPRPSPMPGNPTHALASMGNYLFSTGALDAILQGSARSRGWMDFGTDILPRVCRKLRVFVYDFNRNVIPGMKKGEQNSYWRDVGSIESYYQATMELKSVTPPLNLYNHQWPIVTYDPAAPPVKFVFNDEDRRGFAVDSIISSGTIVSGGRVFDSVLGRNVFVHSWSEVRESILMDGVEIGRRCRIRRAIIDKNVKIPEGTVIGQDPAADRRRYSLSPTGIVVIPKEPKQVRLREMNR
ncbi:MAG TPA: glucose-1-phosphate adenylyltransferase [Candidatus Methanoperedens sp.]|nr:glucose-1-phosphate adenylyltransferase [Candidatus Methanoperedens sp.]